MTAALELKPETRPYEPHGAARDLFYARDFEVLIDGPAGTGKTRAVCEKCHLLCQAIPNLRILWVRATRSSLSESVLTTFETKVVPENDRMLAGAQRWYRHDYVYPNGSRIVLGGMDSVDRIMSSEYDMICVFEATEITENDWEFLLSRLRNDVLSYQQAIADCNPSHPRHWLWLRASAGKMLRLKSEFIDNPSIQEKYIASLANLSGHRRSRLYEGLWAAAEGLVYPDAPRCFVGHYEPPVGILVGGIDFGWSNPFCALAGTVYPDEDGEMHLYIWYERYLSKHGIAKHAKAMPTGHKWWADPAQPEQIRALYLAGHLVAKATNPIVIGIDAVTKRIEKGTLHISNRCRALRAEMDAYRYPDNKMTEKPVDEFNHACDALRYLVMGVDRGRVAK